MSGINDRKGDRFIGNGPKWEHVDDKRSHWPIWLQYTAIFGTIAVVGLVMIYVGIPLTGMAAHNFWKLFLFGWNLISP